MRVYIGQTRSRKLIAELAALGFGECTQRGEGAARRHPWIFDNGAFADFVAARKAGTLERYMTGAGFDGDAYCKAFAKHADSPAPAFVVLPDIVAGGRRSLEFSVDWYDRVHALSLATWGEVPPLYIAVQDGMSSDDIDAAILLGDGVFVGGTTDWKLLAAPGIIRRAHGLMPRVDDSGEFEQHVPVHVGRVGSGMRIVWSRLVGADSIDSCLPLFSSLKREIATFAAQEDLEDALRRFKPGGGIALEGMVGVIRRQFLRGDLDAEELDWLTELEEIIRAAA